MRGYYVGKLSGQRLRQCYDLASPRVKQYLEAETQFVLSRLSAEDEVLELGCGYGRVTIRLPQAARRAVGVDTAVDGLELARGVAGAGSRVEFIAMDAAELTFGRSVFDKVICIQNGISSFGIDPEILIRQARRVTRPGGSLLFSTYSERFWPHRLEWFEAQAAAGLVGPLDHEKTKNGTIVCKDGFRSSTMSPDGFRALGAGLGLVTEITEVDESSLFCEFSVSNAP